MQSKIESKMDLLPINSEVPGIIFRRFQGELDYANILKVISESKAADGVERSDTLEDVRNNYAHLRNCDPYQDMIFVEVDGQVVGYGRAWWNLNDDGDWLGGHLGFLLPEWRRKGIGRAMLTFLEGRLQATAQAQIESGELDPQAARYYEVFAQETEKAKESLLLSAGYQPVRYFNAMVRPDLENLPEAPMPAGLEVRPAQPEHYRQIWMASNEAFRDHWNYVHEGEEELQRWQESEEFQPQLWKIAWDGDQVAGMVLNFVNRRENEEYGYNRGYTEGISVRRPWRKRGLARSLIVQSLKMFKDLGYGQAALGVDSENTSGALRLYESVGFQVIKRSALYRKGF